jgi:hypothetical protein
VLRIGYLFEFPRCARDDRHCECSAAWPALLCMIRFAALAACTRAGAVSSAVEHYLDMVGVTGSNPVPPTIRIKDLSLFRVA